jgi:perosamine synthetase
LDTNWVSSAGSYVDQFEHAIAEQVGVKHAVATVNGTAALHVALLVAGIGPDDEVLVPALTFIAPANAVRYVGAWPVFIDVEPNYWQIDTNKVREFLTNECHWEDGTLLNKTTGRPLKAILPVDILGHPVDMDPLLELARRFNLKVIEDATESLGAKYRDRVVGSQADVACLSFNGNKLITTGGGGMLVTECQDWASQARYLTTQAKDDPLEFVHEQIGYNYRLTNLQAAMGCAQVEQLDAYIAAKRKIAASYSRAFEKITGIASMRDAPWAFSVFWMFTVLVDESGYGMGSRDLLQRLSQVGIETRPLWQPLHQSPAYSRCQNYYCDVAEKINREALTLPCSVGLRPEDQQQVIEQIGRLQCI